MAEEEAMVKMAPEGLEMAWGLEHVSTLDKFIKIGDFYKNQGKMADAEKLYKVALEGKKKVLGPDHISTIDTAYNLGVFYAKQTKMVEAEAMYQQALKGREKVWGPEHMSTLEAVYYLGLVYARQGKMAEAEVMYKRALEGTEKIGGPENIVTQTVANSLGIVYKDQQKIAEAETMYKRALDGFEKVRGSEHTGTLLVVNNLGDLYNRQGRITEAEVMYKRVLDGYERAWGLEHKSTLDAVYNLGLIYAKQDKVAEAEAMYERALEGSEKTQGPKHTFTLIIVNNLGNLYRKQGKLEQAEKMYRRDMKGKLKTFGPLHPSTLQAVDSLRMASLSYCQENALRKKNVSNSVMDLIYLSHEWGTLSPDLSREWGTLSLNLLGALGRALLCSADDFNAEIAFRYQIFSNENSWTYCCICDGCGKTLTLFTGRFVCKSCQDGDVCRDCFDQIKKRRRLITSCVRHSFLKVTPLFLSDSEAGMRIGHNLLSTTRESWFESLKIKYQSASQKAEASIQKMSASLASSTSLTSTSPTSTSTSTSISSTAPSSTSITSTAPSSAAPLSPVPSQTVPSPTVPSSTAPSSENTETRRYRGRLKRPRRRISATPKAIEELKLLPCSATELVCEVCHRIFAVLFRETVQATSAHPRTKEAGDESGSITLFSDYVPPPPAGHKHQSSFAALLQSAASCIMCRLLFNGFVTRGFGSDIETDLNSTHTTQITFNDQSEIGMPNRVCRFLLESSKSGGLLTPSLVIYAKNDQIPDLPLWQNPECVLFDDTLPAIKNWLENCISSHPECALMSGSELSALPTRVIDVGAFDGSTEPCLYITNGQRALYIALSHCWGQCLTLTTTVKTLTDRLEQISMGSLPRSFQDAVLVARKLQVRYLWIDSICIVQDDKIDWECESAKMASIYQNAYVTIAATAAPNSEVGFLYPRLPALRVNFTDLSKVSKINGEKSTVSSETAYVRLDTSDEVSVKDAPLNQRAWVLQEDVLSRRTIHFAKDQLFWLCKQQAISEEGTPVRFISKALARAVSGSGSLDINKRRDLWWQIVEDYSTREIKKKSDKFAALAGITSVIEERFEDKTFAGLSLNDLHYDLFWDVEQETDNPPLGQTPSWSWASLDGQVRKPYIKGPFSKRMEILDTKKLSWSGEVLTSWTAGGALKVHGPLMRTKCALGKDTIRDILEPPQRMVSIYVVILHHLSYLAEYISQNWAESFRRKIPLQRSLGKFTFDRRGSEVEDDIWCLEVARGPLSEFRIVRPKNILLENRENISWSHILILKRVAPNSMTTTTLFLSHLLYLYYFILLWEMLRLGRFEDNEGEFRRLGIGYIEVEDGKFDEKTKSFVAKTLMLI